MNPISYLIPIVVGFAFILTGSYTLNQDQPHCIDTTNLATNQIVKALCGNLITQDYIMIYAGVGFIGLLLPIHLILIRLQKEDLTNITSEKLNE